MGRKEEHIVGLDVGSMKVSTLIAAARESGLEPLGLGVAESKGIKKGAVVNLEAVADSIKRSVGEAEAMARCEIETVYVGLAGPHIKSFNSRGVTSILTRMREINRDDVRRAIETARAIALSPDREIIHILPYRPPSRRLGLHNTHTATPFLPVQHPLTALPHPGRTTSYL